MTEYINKEFYRQIPANERHFIKLSQEAAYAAVKELEAANIPHSATISEYRSIVTVNSADSITAERIAEKAAKEFPNVRTVLGNTEFKFIRDKKYIDTDADTARKIAALLSGNTNNRFSGIIRGDKATITVSGEKNAAAVRAMIENLNNLDLLEALRERGFERTADTNGFVNIRNMQTGEVCGFNSMAALRDMFDNPENEFFYPISHRIAYREHPTNGDYYYYVQIYNSADKYSAKVYRDSENKPVIFRSVDEALSFAQNNGIELTNIDEEISNWREVEREREDNPIIEENRKLIEKFPASNGNYIDLVSYNANTDTFSWFYYNPDGDNGNGAFVDKTITKDDIFAAYSVRVAAENEEQGRNAFIAYLNEKCKEDIIEVYSGYFVEYAGDYINYASRNYAYFFGIAENSTATSSMDNFITHLELNCDEVIRDKEEHAQPQEITEESYRVELDGYSGAWNVIGNAEIDGRELFMLENDYYGDSTAHIVADKDGNVIDDNVWGDFEEYENRLVKRRLIEAAENGGDGTTMPVFKEFAEDMKKYGFDVEEADGLFSAKKADIAGFIYVDTIGEIFYDISEKYRFTPNEVGNNHLLDLNRFYDSYDWNAFSMGKNVYENTVIALQSGNFEPMENYIEQIKSVCENSDGNMLYEESKINEAAEHLEKFKAVFEEKRKSMFKTEQQFPNGELSDEGKNAEISQEGNIHFGYFGNGVLCYDVSRLDKEIDDYLSVAHISNEGNIRYYVDDLSESDKQAIENHAKDVKERFTAYWNGLSLQDRYGRLYDSLLSSGTVEQIRAFDADRSVRDIHEKVKKYEHSLIFKDEEFPVENAPAETFETALNNLILEKNREAVEEIEVGGEITLNGEVYAIKNIDGDFSLSMEKKGDSGAEIKRYVGNWKEQLLNEAGDNALFVYSANLVNDINVINALNAEKLNENPPADNSETISDDTDRTDNSFNFLTDNIPDLDNETAERLVNAFAKSTLAGWDRGDNLPKINRIKKALYDILSDEDKTERAFALISKNVYNFNSDTLKFRFGSVNSDWFTESELLHNFVKSNRNISFALANAVIGYLDEKQHAEREIDELNAGWYEKTSFHIEANIDGEIFDYNGRFDIGDGKGTNGGTLIEHIRQRNENIIKSETYPYNTKEAKDNARSILDVIVPFLENNSAMTREEEEILAEFKENNPIRTPVYKDEMRDDDFEIYQVKNGDKYFFKRFVDLSTLGGSPDISDYDLVYSGKLSGIDITAESKDDILNNIYSKFNVNRPEDFKGRSLSVSDVVVLHKDGIDTAHYVDDIGFKDVPEFLTEKTRAQAHTLDGNEIDVNLPTDTEKKAAEKYRETTRKMFNGIDGYNSDTVEKMISEYISNVFEENEIEAEVGEVVLYGSRSRGLEKDGSDIDIVVQIKSDLKEDALFNILNEEKYIIDGIEVDINPIRAEETGLLEDYLANAEKYIEEKKLSVLRSDMAYLYSEIKFETGEIYLVPGVITDDNIAETAAYKEILEMYADKDNIESLDEMLRVNIHTYRYGSGEETVPNDTEMEFIKTNSIEIMTNSEEVGSTEFFAHFWKNVDDVLNELDSRAAEQHKTSPNLGDEYERRTYIFPSDYISDYPDTNSAVSEIKIGGEWLDTEKAVKNMNAQGNTDTAQIEALRVRTVSYDGIVRNEELSPEAFYIILDRTNNNRDKLKEAAELYENNNGVFMPIYTKTTAEATEAGEKEMYYADRRENQKCASSIDYSISCNNDGLHFNSDTAISDLLNTYSLDRITLIIAARVSDAGEWDRRFSRDNLEWAKNVVKAYPAEQVEAISHLGLKSHSVLLDAAASELRKNYELFRSMQNVKADISETEQQNFIDNIKNLSQLKRELKAGTEFVITNHARKECIGERRRVTEANTACFYSQKINANGEAEGKPLYMEWGKAKNWNFENGVCTSSLDNNDIVMSFKVLDNNLDLNITDESKIADNSVIYADKNSPMGNSAEERHIAAADIAIGDKFLYKGEEVTVSSFKGVYPDDVGISKYEKSGGIEFEVTKNVDKFDLARNGIYLGNPNREKLDEVTKDTDTPAVPTEYDGQKIRAAVNKLIDNHDFSTETEKFLNRTANQLIINKRENVDPKMFTSIPFRNDYGTIGRIDEKLFDGKLMQIIDELNGYISGKDIKDAQKENATAVDNSPMGNFTPQINDVVENEEGAYKVANISENFVTLLETDTLLPSERIVSMTDFYKSNFSLIERDEAISETVNTEMPVEKTEKPVNKAENYNITDVNFGDVGGAKNRYAANIEAIKLLKSLEADNRTATAEEQSILAKYTGWGAISQAFDGTNDKWSNEYAELKELLTPEEYEAARHSTMNAHYTSPTVISAMYDVLDNLGFVKGNILEPAMGTGNFFGMLPELYKDSKLYGVELDSITGRIAQQLYPNADIQIKAYENTSFPDNSFDVAIGNVPFGDYKVFDKRYNDNNFNIHDYFFAKTLDKVHAGGIIAFVTSKGTMDKENDEIRKYIAQRAELLGAIRLPNNAFKATAGTDVTSDILILQKRERPIEINPDSVEWLKKSETADGFSVNNYFVQHPEMVLGKITEGNKLYGNSTNDTSCIPIEGADLKQQLAEAVKNIKGTYKAADIEIEPQNDDIIPAPANSRKFSFYAVDGNIYYREADETMKKINVSKDIFNRAMGMIELRDSVHKLLNLQLANSQGYLDNEVAESREKLNTLYDSFVAKYGNISTPKNAKAFKGDNGYSILSALETKDENGKVVGKADIFTKNTLKPKIIATHVETAEEALILSVSEKGKVDFDFMTELCGMDKDRLISELEGQIYKLPQETEKYVTADEYLSGNIRKKMRDIENCPTPEEYQKNYEALQAAMPPRVEAKDISVKLGSHWVDPKYIRQFILEKLNPDARTESELNVSYSKVAGIWKIEGQSATARTNHTATNTYGTYRLNAYDIIEGILNNSDLLVKDRARDEFGVEMRDKNGKYVLVTNDEETKAVKHCANIIKSEFVDWIFKDPDRRDDLVNKYNEIFNSFRYREYDGSHLNFVGMNTDITLKEHQKNAIARGLYGGNTLLAHAVGAGKTYEMIAIAMEGKRLGLHNKSLFAVPNSLTEQIGNDFRKLYPNANILVATKKDFEKQNRANLLAKMATNDWDAVIVGHSQFDRMGLSPERESAYLKREIKKLRDELDKLKAENPKSKSFTVKNIEKSIESYTKKLKDLTEKQVKDDFIDFEQLGFDKIFVDECHMYKNLATATKMHNVAGLGSRGSARAFNLLMKAKYLNELTDGKGCVFASGTPVSNSMTELYTLMRYLQADTLKDLGIDHFDEWAADFGEVITDYELKPESDGKYQLKTRFAKFTNLPELMSIFKQAADIRTADTLDLEKPISDVKEIMAKPSRIQKRGIKALGERASKIRLGGVDPRDDNMLCVTNDGRKIGLDQRLINPALPDDPNSKVNMCVQNVFDIYTKTADKRSTQCIFCDLSTPKTESRQDRFAVYRPDNTKGSGFDIIRKKSGIKKETNFAAIKEYVKKNADEEEDKLQDGDIAVIRRPNEDKTKIISEAAIFENGKFNTSHSDELLEKLEMSPIEDMPPKEFNIYDDIKNKLVEQGIPEKEIAFIHDFDTPEQKQGLFNKMNAGEVRILLGSTSKCGAGMNAQKKMIALHHLDAPMRPSDMEQRNGRIERQGNENPEVQIYRYVTDRTFDAYLYQMLENKQKFISQVMTSKTPERVCADIDEAALDYAEVKALCAGNPLIKEEMELQNKIKDLKMEKSRYSENIYEMQDKIRVKYPEEIRIAELINKHNQQDLDLANAAEFVVNEEGKKVYPIEICGVKYTDRKEGGNAIKTALGANIGRIAEGRTVEIGTYRGMKLSVYQHDLTKKIGACLEGYKNHYCELNPETDIGNVVRLDNCINNIAEGIKKTEEEINSKKADLEVMKIDVEKPFPRAEELFKAETRLEEVHIELTQFELNDDSKEKDLYERLCDNFPEILSGQRKAIQYEAFGNVINAELKGELFTLTSGSDEVTQTTLRIDYENEKAIPISLNGMELSAEIDEKNAYFVNMDKWLDKLEDKGFKEIEQDVQTGRDNISL